MKEFEVILFRKDNGESPVEEFIDTLEPKMQAKVLRTMELLRKNGLELYYIFSWKGRRLFLPMVLSKRQARPLVRS